MTDEDIMQELEDLYPIDCQYEDTNRIGEVLLLRAIKNHDWRDLPVEILREYHRLSIDEENNGEVTGQLREKGIIT